MSTTTKQRKTTRKKPATAKRPRLRAAERRSPSLLQAGRTLACAGCGAETETTRKGVPLCAACAESVGARVEVLPGVGEANQRPELAREAVKAVLSKPKNSVWSSSKKSKKSAKQGTKKAGSGAKPKNNGRAAASSPRKAKSAAKPRRAAKKAAAG